MVLMLTVAVCTVAQTARQVLDKAAAVVSNKQGVTARFTMSGAGEAAGTIQMKANKLHVATQQAIIWCDGTTQWTYMKQSDEVNVAHPSKKQMETLNPVNFINMYKKGYRMDMTRQKAAYCIHLTAEGERTVPEMYITVNSQNYHPTEVRMLQGRKDRQLWTTFTISDLKVQKLSDNVFRFNQKDFPTAEIIDLR